MGSGSSSPSVNVNDVRQNHMNVKGQFEKEFGKLSISENDAKNIDTPQGISQQKQMSINPGVFKAKRLFMRPINARKPKENKLLVRKQNNNALLQEIYRRMDPTRTTVSPQVIVGHLEVAIKYKQFEETLMVKINRAKNLQKDGIGMPDPYVLISLFSASDSSDVLTQSTRTKSDTCDPIFEEILVFPLVEKQIPVSKIRVGVWDKDIITQDDFLGEAVIELCKLDLAEGNSHWYKLHPQTDTSITGSIDVAITVEDPNKIVVSVDQAYDLKASHVADAQSNPYVQLYVTGIPAKMETKVIENTLNPEWNEEHEFTIHPDEFSRRIVVLNVLSREKHGRDKRLGDVHIPLIDFDVRHSGMRRNYLLQDLRNTPHTRSKWAKEGLSIEFHEAMKAHAIYGYPKFFFKTVHSGKKVVTCRSMKARSEARMIVVNGAPSLEGV